MRIGQRSHRHSNQFPHCECHRHACQHRNIHAAAPIITPSPTITPVYPLKGYGPTNFPANVEPLTGLPVGDPGMLQRRPMLIKVLNLPHNVRPKIIKLSYLDFIAPAKVYWQIGGWYAVKSPLSAFYPYGHTAQGEGATLTKSARSSTRHSHSQSCASGSASAAAWL
jgi:hypothetical protein